jgi:hypothetical protein
MNMAKLFRYVPMLMLTGVALASPACAARIYETGPRAVYVPPRGDYRAIAARSGYRDGIEEGRNDARHHERFDPVRSRRYRSGDRDYDRRYGSRDEFAREYRANFERGYREGYERARNDRR